MIPKKIHYCWFGGKEKPKLAKKCIDSWEKYCPDYEIIEWNEDNFDLDVNDYVRYCYRNKKWAYLSDYVRLFVVNEYGGVYLDTDVELIASIDELLHREAFYSFENDVYVNTGLGFGAEKGHITVKKMLHEYQKLHPNGDEMFHFAGCPKLNTDALVKLGLRLDGTLQTVSGAVILPCEYMNPYDDLVGRLNKTEKTISIHWYSKSALSSRAIFRSKVTKVFHRLFGIDCFRWMKRK